METVKVVCNDKAYRIKKEVIIHVLKCLSGMDYSKEDDEILVKIMKEWHLIDEVTLKSMVNQK